MFASSGYFRGLPCPYFTSGLCERKYCHFRHVKQPDDTNDIAFHGRLASATENGASYLPSPVQAPEPQRHSSLLGMVGSAIQQMQRDSRHDMPKYSTNKPPVCTTSAAKPAAVSYQPTPIVKGGGPAKRDVAATRKNVEYKPTPIPLLKQLQEQRKQDMSGASELEYDPLTNFSTSGPSESWCTTRVTLGDVQKYEAAPKRKCDWIVESSNKKMRNAHDHCGDSDSDDDIVAQFSDDEEDESGIASCVEKSKMNESESVEKKTNKTGGGTERSGASSTEVSKASKQVDVKPGPVVAANSGSDTLDRKPVLDLLQESLSTVNSDSGCVTIKQEPDTDCFIVPSNGMKKELCEDLQNGHASKTSQARNSGKGSAEKSSETSKTSSDDKKRTSSKKPSTDKHCHRDSKSSKSSSSDKRHSSGDKNKTNSGRSSTKHRHSSATKHGSHSNKNSKSSGESGHSSGSKSHSSGTKHRQGINSGSSSSSSSKENSSGKNKPNVSPAVSRSNSLASDSSKTTEGRHLCESKTNGKGLNRSLSHADLFGDDSDSDSTMNRPGGLPMGAAPIEISDDSAYDDDIMLLSPERPPVEDFSEPEDLYDECLSIFNEQKSSHSSEGHGKTTKNKKKVNVSEMENEMAAVGKMRVARMGSADSTVKRLVSRSPAFCPSPAEVMHNRLKQMQEKQKQTALNSKTTTSNGNISKATHAALERRMACNLPNRRLTDMSGAATECTITASKVASRVAHAAKQSAAPRPTIPADFGNKVPTSIRQRYLSLMIDECLKIYPAPQDAYDRALGEEKTAYSRSSGRNIYLRVAVNAIKKLRSEVADTKGGEGVTSPKVRTHEAMLGGMKAHTTSFTVKRCGALPKCQDEFKGADLYRRLTPYILTEDQLVENGYPQPAIDGGLVSLKVPDGKQLPKPNSNSRLCCRCGTRFDVLPTKDYAKKEQCVYHWGKCWKRKVAGCLDSRYTCCGGDLGTPGCAVGEWHAYETNKYTDLSGYMKTIPGSHRPCKDYGVYSMDCEMVYTMGGCELARVTVIGPDLETVFEKVVKPDHRIIDYNTRFSGLTEKDLAGVETTLRDVQAVLLSLFTDKTILIGHSLESDLVALKLIHSTVVDTSNVFPHRLGAPYKRALRTLMADFLQRIIQNDVGGHDSSEDAIACMELMLWQLKEDARKEART